MPSFYHCSELAKLPAGLDRSVASLATMATTNLVSSALQLAEAFMVF